MEEKEEKRMAGNYEIMSSIHIGEKEIVFGVDETNPQPYFCAYFREVFMYGQYEDCMAGDDYVEMVELFAGRIQEQCSRLLEEREKMTVPFETIKAEMCRPFSPEEDIAGKIVVISPEILRPEYRCQAEQIALVTGGNGANGRGLGSACFCTNLYTGEKARWERYHLQGELKPECMPEWAKEKLAEMQAKEKEKTKKQKKDREVR